MDEQELAALFDHGERENETLPDAAARYLQARDACETAWQALNLAKAKLGTAEIGLIRSILAQGKKTASVDGKSFTICETTYYSLPADVVQENDFHEFIVGLDAAHLLSFSLDARGYGTLCRRRELNNESLYPGTKKFTKTYLRVSDVASPSKDLPE